MIAGTTVIALAAALALIALGVAIAVLVRIWRGAVRPRDLVHDVAMMVVGWVVWLVAALVFRPAIESSLVLPIGGLAGVAAVLVTLGLERGGIRPRWGFVYTAIWTAVVFSPVVVAVFSVTEGVLGAGLRTLDLGGALPVLVAAGAASAAVLVAEPPIAASPRAVPTGGVILAPFTVVWVLWLLWLVGLELRLDELTPQIILNGIVAPMASMAAWLIVQRVRYARTTPLAAVGGLLTGLAAVTAGCAYLNTVGAAITGAIAGAVCSLVGYAAAKRSGSSEWLLAVVLLIGGGIGVVVLGLFATRAGLIFTGQPEVLFAQTASVVSVAIYSGVLSLALWWVLRTPHRRVTQVRAVG